MLTLILILLPTKFVEFVDTESFGAKILSDSVVTGIKSVVFLSITWFALLTLSSNENKELFDLFGKQRALELLGLVTFYVNALMLFGVLYGIAKHQVASRKIHEKSLSNFILRSFSIMPAVMVLGTAIIHIQTFGYLNTFMNFVTE